MIEFFFVMWSIIILYYRTCPKRKCTCNTRYTAIGWKLESKEEESKSKIYNWTIEWNSQWEEMKVEMSSQPVAHRKSPGTKRKNLFVILLNPSSSPLEWTKKKKGNKRRTVKSSRITKANPVLNLINIRWRVTLRCDRVNRMYKPRGTRFYQLLLRERSIGLLSLLPTQARPSSVAVPSPVFRSCHERVKPPTTRFHQQPYARRRAWLAFIRPLFLSRPRPIFQSPADINHRRDEANNPLDPCARRAETRKEEGSWMKRGWQHPFIAIIVVWVAMYAETKRSWAFSC